MCAEVMSTEHTNDGLTAEGTTFDAAAHQPTADQVAQSSQTPHQDDPEAAPVAAADDVARKAEQSPGQTEACPAAAEVPHLEGGDAAEPGITSHIGKCLGMHSIHVGNAIGTEDTQVRATPTGADPSVSGPTAEQAAASKMPLLSHKIDAEGLENEHEASSQEQLDMAGLQAQLEDTAEPTSQGATSERLATQGAAEALAGAQAAGELKRAVCNRRTACVVVERLHARTASMPCSAALLSR
jgi:hypothetical protein